MPRPYQSAALSPNTRPYWRIWRWKSCSRYPVRTAATPNYCALFSTLPAGRPSITNASTSAAQTEPGVRAGEFAVTQHDRPVDEYVVDTVGELARIVICRAVAHLGRVDHRDIGRVSGNQQTAPGQPKSPSGMSGQVRRDRAPRKVAELASMAPQIAGKGPVRPRVRMRAHEDPVRPAHMRLVPQQRPQFLDSPIRQRHHRAHRQP